MENMIYIKGAHPLIFNKAFDITDQSLTKRHTVNTRQALKPGIKTWLINASLMH